MWKMSTFFVLHLHRRLTANKTNKTANISNNSNCILFSLSLDRSTRIKKVYPCKRMNATFLLFLFVYAFSSYFAHKSEKKILKYNNQIEISALNLCGMREKKKHKQHNKSRLVRMRRERERQKTIGRKEGMMTVFKEYLLSFACVFTINLSLSLCYPLHHLLFARSFL